MKEIEVHYWDWTESLDTDDKSSSTDYGKEIFEYIVKNEIKPIKEITT